MIAPDPRVLVFKSLRITVLIMFLNNGKPFPKITG
jgi:hypothetical protein